MKRFIFLIIEKIRKALKVDEKGNSYGWGKGTLLLAALMVVGCVKDGKVDRSEFVVVELDSCEYIKWNVSYGYQHKGNCKFCAERRKQELKELVEQLKEK